MTDATNQNDQTMLPLNEPCAVIWDTPNGRERFIGMTRSIVDEESYTIEYLQRYTNDSSIKGLEIPSNS